MTEKEIAELKVGTRIVRHGGFEGVVSEINDLKVKISWDDLGPYIEDKNSGYLRECVFIAKPYELLQPKEPTMPAIIPIKDLPSEPDNVVIEGILRVGETAIFAAPPMFGMSWAMLDLAMKAVTESEWIGHKCKALNALYINTELRPSEISRRVDIVCPVDCKAKINTENRTTVNQRVSYMDARLGITATELHKVLAAYRIGTFELVIIDAFVCDSKDELDRLIRMADELKLALVLCVRSKKPGFETEDVGVGCQTRAVDSIVTFVARFESWIMDIRARSFDGVVAKRVVFEYPRLKVAGAE